MAQESDLLVVAPATADLMAKFAHGLADDFLSTLYLAFTGPVVLAPAMNTNMWRHPATQANLEILRRRGHAIVGPDEGSLACGTVGPGRMSEPEKIADAVLSVLNPRQRPGGRDGADHRRADPGAARPGPLHLQPLHRQDGLCAGRGGRRSRRARSSWSPARCISPAPPGVTLVHVRTALEMREAVFGHLEPATIVIKAAAVADYHVASVPQQKIKKTAARISLELDPTPDILAELGQKKGDRLLIGFAAETENLRQEARRKLQRKNCDMVVGNLVGQDGTGFESDTNEVILALATGDVVDSPAPPSARSRTASSMRR